MAIDVLNQMWVGVFSASFVAQYEDERRRIGTAPVKLADYFCEEACAVADLALECYRRDSHLPTSEGARLSAQERP